MADFIVAVTGGVASGKSAATRAFESLGITVAAWRAWIARDTNTVATRPLRRPMAFVPGAFSAIASAASGSWRLLHLKSDHFAMVILHIHNRIRSCDPTGRISPR